ncbi:RNA-directed DNA polymerase, eukaryota [Tanacetum coccineum]
MYNEERWGSVFNSHGANAFNSFISNSGLNDIQLEGFSFTWAHPSATKMSKLDRFLMSNGLLSAFPLISAICLDRHLSDHRPILLKEVFSDFGPTPFRFYHSWLELPGFDDLVSKSWNSFTLDDSNGMIRFKKKLQMLKKEIRAWTLDFKRHQVGLSKDLKSKLCDIDKVLDQGGVTDDILLSRLEVLKQLHDVQSSNNRDIMQKAKIRWAIEGDENSKYFHAIINKKQKPRQSSVKGNHGNVIGLSNLILLNKSLEGTLRTDSKTRVLDESYEDLAPLVQIQSDLGSKDERGVGRRLDVIELELEELGAAAGFTDLADRMRVWLAEEGFCNTMSYCRLDIAEKIVRRRKLIMALEGFEPRVGVALDCLGILIWEI